MSDSEIVRRDDVTSLVYGVGNAVLHRGEVFYPVVQYTQTKSGVEYKKIIDYAVERQDAVNLVDELQRTQTEPL